MTPLEVAWAAPVFTLIGAIVGATITATVGWFESRRRREHDRRQDDAALAERQRVAMTSRASEFLAATYHAVLAMRDVALAPDDHKREIEKREIWPTVDRVNRCLTAVKVNDSNELVAAAVALDAALVELSRSAHSMQYDQESWRLERTRIVGDLPDRLTTIARREARALQSGKPVMVVY